MSASACEVMIVTDAHELGGAETYLLTLVNGVRDRVDVEVAAGDRAPAELIDQVREAGAATRIVRGLGRRPRAAALVRLTRLLRARRPALVHVNLSDQGDGLVAVAAARLAGVPVTATLHLVLPERAGARERLAGAALRATRAVIAVSAAVGSYLESRGVTAEVIHNGIAAPRPLPDARAQLNLGEADLVVGGIGRLDPQKGWDVLTVAAAAVHERCPRARFVVIGDGPERDRLAGAQDPAYLRFVGFRERAADLLPAMDILAVPSRYEGFGLVAAEAMLAGVPVVASRVGGLPEVLGDAGTLVAPEDPTALAGALIELLEDPERRRDLAARGARRAAERFAEARMCDETLALWRSITVPGHANPPVASRR